MCSSTRYRRRGNTTSGIIAVLIVGAVAVIAMVYGLSQYGAARKRAEATATPPGGLPVSITPESVDFGTLAPRESSSATFELVNTGDAPVTLAGMKASCKCTTLEDLTGAVLEPGVPLSVTARMSGSEAGGSNRSNISFIFDGYPPAKVTMKARYRRGITARPPFLDAFHDERSGTLELTAVDGRPFRVLSVNGRDPVFEGHDPAGAVLDRYALRWGVAAYDETTCVNGNGDRVPMFWVIETDHPNAPIVELILRHRCNLPEPLAGRKWNPSGKHRVVGRLAPGESAIVEIPIRWLSDVEPDDEFTAVISSVYEIRAELIDVREIEGKPTCRVRITPSPEYRGLFVVSLRVHATRHRAPFTVMGTVREQARGLRPDTIPP